MSMPVPTAAQLAQFSGVPLEQYDSFADQALIQSVMFFQVITELTEMPTDPVENMLAYYGILSYADALYLDRAYREIKISPMQSEKLGSYSYSKPSTIFRGTAATNALKGEQTGIVWFDLAVQQLALRTQRGGVFSFSIALSLVRAD